MRLTLFALVLLAVLAAMPATAVLSIYDGTHFTGMLNAAPVTSTSGGLIPSQLSGYENDWWSPNTTISWDVWWDAGYDHPWDDGMGGWNYSYDITFGHQFTQVKRVSHFLLEVSPTSSDEIAFSLGNAMDYSDAQYTIGGNNSNLTPQLQEWDPAASGNSNPGLVSKLYGIKLDFPDVSGLDHIQWSFHSMRVPIWGDYYAKDGRDSDRSTQSGQQTNGSANNSPTVAIWNNGLNANGTDGSDTDPDIRQYSLYNVYLSGQYPDTYRTDGLFAHILRPDTSYDTGPPPPATPELSTWLLLSLSGLAGAIVIRRRKS